MYGLFVHRDKKVAVVERWPFFFNTLVKVLLFSKEMTEANNLSILLPFSHRF